MNLQELQAVADDVRYKLGWCLHVKVNDHLMPYLQWGFYAPDYTTPARQSKLWTTRKWYLSEYMCESEVVQTALAAAIMAEEHEAREAFVYKGQQIFNPHISLAAMQVACTQLETR